MRKKRFLFLSAVVVAIAVFSVPAWGSITGTPHDITALAPAFSTYGVCSACHVPHKATGSRLWPSDMSTAAPARGEVGQLCTYCHELGTGIVGAAGTQQPFKDTNAKAHGLTKTNAPDGVTALDDTLPYVPTPEATFPLIECTSCHDVHNWTYEVAAPYNGQPFLRDDIDALCSRCHPNRLFVGGAAATVQGSWDAHYGYDRLVPANGNPGSHPVGTDVFTDTSQHDVNNDGTSDSDSPITTTFIGILDYDTGGAGAASNHNLGPHLIDGGVNWQNGNGMTCVTCHAVHGVQPEGAAFGPANDDLLVIEQLATNPADPNPMNRVANGQGSSANDLCEVCHRGDLVGGVAYGGTLFPNPGQLFLYTHPVDDYFYGDYGVTAIPADWPTGVGGENVPDLICESCHQPHPKAAFENNGGSGVNVSPATGDGTNNHIIRADEGDLCNQCHSPTQPLVNHHPIGIGLMTAAGFADPLIGDQDGDLECSDCHNGTGAHNWQATGVGLDPDWEPWDNGRPDVCCSMTPGKSKECFDCHTTATRMSPTRPDPAPGVGTYPAQYHNQGDASHWVGNFNATPSDCVNGWGIGGPAINPPGAQDCSGGTFTCDPWVDSGCSQLGTTSGVTGPPDATALLVCESCHTLIPAWNVGHNALLLENYEEGLDEMRSALCEGCHSPQATKTGNPHPMTSDTISKALKANRTPTTLITDPVNGYADRDPIVPHVHYPTTANRLNCDSCHQPHNAYDSGGVYILEGDDGSNADLTPSLTGTPDDDVVIYDKSWTMDWNASQVNYTKYCGQCHASGF